MNDDNNDDNDIPFFCEFIKLVTPTGISLSPSSLYSGRVNGLTEFITLISNGNNNNGNKEK